MIFALLVGFLVSGIVFSVQEHDAKNVDVIPVKLKGLGYIREDIPLTATVSMLGVPPPSWDWRNVNGTDYMTPVKDQGQCGSCVAFATLGAFEAVIKIKEGITTDLSEAHLFFCGGGECDVGWYIPPALDYLKINGTPDEDCFPYDGAYYGTDLSCGDTCDDWQQRAWKINDWGYITGTTNIKSYLIEYGPLVVTYTVYTDFDDYWANPDAWPDQVYYHYYGTERGGHAVVLVGYDDEGQYWICKNSWGTDGGLNGYFKIKYGEPAGSDDLIDDVAYYLYYQPAGVNNPPVADFDYSPSFPTTSDTIQFTDLSYDVDGTIVSWYWDFGDGATSTQQNPQHRYADDGVYRVTLTVTDNDGASNSTYKFITVANTPPVANFDYLPSSPTTHDIIQFTDLSYDSDGSIVNWTWDFGDGNISYEQNPQHQYADNGIYNVTLTVKDDDGARSSVIKQITVANIPPVANFTWQPAQPTDIENVTFNATLSYDMDGFIVNYTWNFGDGSIAYGMIVEHGFEDDGIYNVTLTVTDNDGATDSIVKQITVANVFPIANFSYEPKNPTTQDIIYFNSTSYDLDGFIVNYTWDFGDGNVSYEKNTTHKYADDGTYNVTLTIIDDDGAQDNISKVITVINTPPIANFTWYPENPTDLEIVYFTDLSYDSDGSIVNWTWDFGDENISYEQNPQHQYADNGIYSIILTITDDDNASVTITKNITILNELPHANFSYSENYLMIYFNSTSYDLDGFIVNYTWNFGDGSIAYEQNPVHKYASSGNYTVILIVRDDDGAINLTQKIISFETNPPVTECNFVPSHPDGENGWYVSDVTIFLNATDETGVNITYYRIDNGSWKEYTGEFNIAQEGIHVVSFYSVDYLKNVEEIKQIELFIDKTPPVMHMFIIPATPDGWNNWYTGNVTIMLAAKDNLSSLQYIMYQINGGHWQFAGDNITIVFHEGGIYCLNYSAVDYAGNEEETKTYCFKIDKNPPITEIQYSVTNDNISIALLATDDLSGVNETEYSIDNSSWIVYGSPFFISRTEHHIVRYRSVDNASNEEEIKMLTLRHPYANFSWVPAIPNVSEEIVFIDASYDEDGFIVNYTWNFGDGSIAYGRNVTHRYEEHGIYTVILRVVDDDGMINFSTKQITINSIPKANFSWIPSTPKTKQMIMFDASSSHDLDGEIVLYEWDWNNDGIYDEAEKSPIAKHSWDDNGNYTVALRVIDNNNASNVSKKMITVENRPPSVDFSFSPLSPEPGEAVYFSSNCYDMDGYVISYNWSFGDDTFSTLPNPPHVYSSSGIYVITLTIKDDDGSTNITSKSINVNSPPVANFVYMPAYPVDTDIITFLDSSIDSDGSIVNWTWDFGDGNISYGKNITHKYKDDGVYNVTLTIIDDDGAWDSIEKQIEVANAPPLADFTWQPHIPEKNEMVYFNSTSYDLDGIIVNHTWDFGDGNVSYEKNTTHKYADDGTYNVTLTIIDDDGAEHSISYLIEVKTKKETYGFELTLIIVAFLLILSRRKIIK